MDPEEGSTKTADNSDSNGAGIDQAEAYANDPQNSSTNHVDDIKDKTNAKNSATENSGSGGIGGSIKAFSQRNKKPLLGGGIGAAIAGLIIAGVFALIPLKLLHIAENLFHHNFARQENSEIKEGRKVLKSIVRSANTGETGNQNLKKNPILNKIANVKIERFKAELKAKGFDITFDKTGRLIKIVGPAPDKVNLLSEGDDFWTRRSAALRLVDEVVPHYRVGKLIKYRRLMAAHSRVSFRFWPADKASKFKDYMSQKVRVGATDVELKENYPTTGPDGKPVVEPTGPTESKAGRGFLKESVAKVTDSYAKTLDSRVAIEDGLSFFKSGAAVKTLTVTGILSLLCSAQDLAVNAVEEGKVKKTAALVRHGNVILTTASQMKEGKLTGEQFNEFMKVFDGVNAITVDENGKASTSAKTHPEDTKNFDQSAAWKRAAGEPVDSSNPDLSAAANPNKGAFQAVVGKIESILDATGGSKICAVLTSKLGILVQIAGAVAQIGANLSTFGGAQVATAAGGVAVVAILYKEVLPHVFASLANVAVTGSENPVQFLNNTDAGLVLSSSDYSRRLGGRQQSNTEVQQANAEVKANEIADAKSKGFFYQSFAIANPNSITSKIVMSAHYNF